MTDMEWKPIETAPKDGRKILVWSVYQCCPEVAYLDGTHWYYADCILDVEMLSVYWSHWTEIVPPPEDD